MEVMTVREGSSERLKCLYLSRQPQPWPGQPQRDTEDTSGGTNNPDDLTQREDITSMFLRVSAVVERHLQFFFFFLTMASLISCPCWEQKTILPCHNASDPVCQNSLFSSLLLAVQHHSVLQEARFNQAPVLQTRSQPGVFTDMVKLTANLLCLDHSDCISHQTGI